jgi:hypothetical protein
MKGFAPSSGHTNPSRSPTAHRRNEDAVHGLEEHERIHVVARRRVAPPFESAAFERFAGVDRVVEVEGIRALVEFLHPRALRCPRENVLHLPGGNRDARAIGAHHGGVATHVVGMAVRVDQSLERLAVETRGTREQLQRAFAMRAIPRIDEHVVAGREHHDLVAIQPTALDHAQRRRQHYGMHNLDLMLLDGLRVVTTALNLPGPAACARLRDMGAAVSKVEPPAGDPMERFNASWYGKLHEGGDDRTPGPQERRGPARDGQAARRSRPAHHGAARLRARSHGARSRLARSRSSKALPRRDHRARIARDELAGHDLTYLAAHGLVVPPAMPRTLYADVAGAERAVSTALALVIARDRTGKAHRATAALADAAAALAQPLHQGLTRPGAILGGGNPAYNLYAAREGWIAVAALEPHFEKKLGDKFALGKLTIEALGSLFSSHDAEYWEEWGRRNDIPIVAVRETSES